MGTRKSAAALSTSEVDRFVAAVHQLRDTAVGSSSIYDRFVALHGAVMSVEVRFASGQSQRNNMAHWNIGFCPWHRQYLREFELELQAIDDTVSIPYWDWADHSSVVADVFSPRLLGSFGPDTGPESVTDGPFAELELVQALQESWGGLLARGGGLADGWPPETQGLDWLEDLRVSLEDRHPLWVFWQILEAGYANVLPHTHNAAHNFVGGHMAGDFSPNDPAFWLHHANVDRLWARWQENFVASGAGSLEESWPQPAEASPLDGSPAPYGHRRDDLMWPWVGSAAPAFASLSVSPAAEPMLPDPAGLEAVRVRDVLDINALGYDYI